MPCHLCYISHRERCSPPSLQTSAVTGSRDRAAPEDTWAERTYACPAAAGWTRRDVFDLWALALSQGLAQDSGCPQDVAPVDDCVQQDSHTVC